MKNLSIIFLLVILFFGLVFAAYIAAFKLYFSSDKLINTTKHFSRMTFQRDIQVSGMSFSPFGSFNIRSFSMAAKGGFKNGVLFSINKTQAKVDLLKLIKRELYISGFASDGINIRLNYENNRKFDYESFFSNVRFIFMQDGKRVGLLKKIAVSHIVLANANIDLLLDRGSVQFKNITFTSDLFESGNDFSGDVSFDLEFNGRQLGCAAKFFYDTVSKSVVVTELRCEDFSLNASGYINFLKGGKVSLDFNVSSDKEFFVKFLNVVTGKNYLTDSYSSSEIVEGVKVVYDEASDLEKNNLKKT